MRIQRIITRGFKTYRDSTIIGEFDDHLNCIVGLNGSGKSSIFASIIFVLCPTLSSAGSMLHEGSTGKSLSGFVELELVNRTDGVVTSLRRTINAANGGSNVSDEFLIDGKSVSRTEYISFLQTVGLQGATTTDRNQRLPYYIVEQGRVTSVATLTDTARFTLLKEACGIDVFAEKKIESLKILEETKLKKEKIEALFGDIESKCLGLEREVQDMDE